MTDQPEDLEALTTELARLREEALAEEAGTEVVTIQGSAEEARRNLVLAQAAAGERMAQMERVQRRVKSEVERRKRELEEAAYAAQELMAPLKAQMAALQEGIWTIQLYLGTSEQVVTIRDGRPAPAEEPIVLRQLVLAMDEETAINPHADGIDFREVERGAFDDWLLKAEENVQQVIPEQRCVVALVPRYRSKEHEDPWLAQEAEKRDKQTYFLVRNGEQLFRIWTDFRVGRVLLPRRDEFADLFTREETDWSHPRHERRRRALKPGSRDWERAQEAADARQRHYMRVALILEGLLHRTTLWHPLPDAPVSFVDESVLESGRVRYVMDGEDDRLIGTGREPFGKWLRRLQAEMRPGMRVIVDGWGAHGEGWSLSGGRGWHNPRLWPEGAERPPTGVLLTVKEKTPDGFKVSYPRTEERYYPREWVPSETRPGWGHYGAYRVPKTPAVLTVKPGDDWVLPFDLATERECGTYLRARLDRHDYARMFPILKAAIVAKQAEAEEERPFAVMLAGVLARENGVEVAEAEAAVPDLIRWYKLANKWHRALKEDDAKAVREVVAEHARRLEDRKRGPDPRIVEELRTSHPDALLIGRKRSGEYGVLLPADRRNVHVHELEYGVRSGLRWRKDWRIPGTHYSRWMVAYEAERWAKWDRTATAKDHLTGPEAEGFLGRIRERVPAAFAITSGEDRRERSFVAWVAGGAEYKAGGRKREVETRYVAQGEEVHWTRERDGIKLHERYWGGTPIATLRGGRLELRKKALWLDEERCAAAESAYAKREARSKAKQEKGFEVGAWVRRYRESWAAREEERAKARFREEYQAPEGLWEGHKKLHPVPEPDEAPDWDSLRPAIKRALKAQPGPWGALIEEVDPKAPEEVRGLRFPPEPPRCEHCGGEVAPGDLSEDGLCEDCVAETGYGDGSYEEGPALLEAGDGSGWVEEFD